MKRFIFILLILLSVLLAVIATGQNRKPKPHDDKTIIAGQIMKIGDVPPKDKDTGQFRLIKYKVINTCRGEYNKEEIIVSHFPDEELDDLKVGDKLCLILIKTVGPTVFDDFTVDLKGTETHYTQFGAFIKNCECQK